MAEAAKIESGFACAYLDFKCGWVQSQTGDLIGGGLVSLKFDSRRLPHFRRDNTADWGIEAFIKFEPSGITARGPVRDGPLVTSIPVGTRELQVWFKNWSESYGQMYECFDSQYGANYHFSVKRTSAPTGG